MVKCPICNGLGDWWDCASCQGSGLWSEERLGAWQRGRQIRAFRRERGETLAEAALRRGVSITDVARAEAGLLGRAEHLLP
ncbi:MAG: hypothetical protein QNJ16_19960 [Rhodobacter sp.]|nr:hypothetical protein [Rhodobacter sp.]